jgi:hypothetical protein
MDASYKHLIPADMQYYKQELKDIDGNPPMNVIFLMF